MTDAIEYWYRYRDIAYAAPLDEFDSPIGEGRVRTHLDKYPVLKTTPKGVWLNGHHGRRFVRREALRRYACPTMEEARVSFIARKHAQIRIYAARIRQAERALAALEEPFSNW